MVNSCGYCSQDLLQADQRSTVEQKQENEVVEREKRKLGSASKKGVKGVVTGGGTSSAARRTTKWEKAEEKKREKKEKKKKGMEKKEEAEKPIVVRETKEICILSNCRLEVRGRVRNTEGER